MIIIHLYIGTFRLSRRLSPAFFLRIRLVTVHKSLVLQSIVTTAFLKALEHNATKNFSKHLYHFFHKV